MELDRRGIHISARIFVPEVEKVTFDVSLPPSVVFQLENSHQHYNMPR
jgi:hypothetical protein